MNTTTDSIEMERDFINSPDADSAFRTFLRLAAENRCVSKGGADHSSADHSTGRGMIVNGRSNLNNTDKEAIAALAALPALEYERQRELQAMKLGCRVAMLDSLVEAERGKANGTLQGSVVTLRDVEVWPEKVKGAEVLRNLAESFTRYLALPDGGADSLALWCAHTHLFDAFICSPRLNITSPERGCGKSTLRDVVSLFVPRPVLTENLSVAVLFRLVHAQAPVILADEYDAWVGDNEELRGLLNAGHRRGAAVYRCEGDRHEVRGFNAYTPAVLCGIGGLPGTLHDRSIVLRLDRARAGELSVRFDPRHTESEKELCRQLARWCADNRGRIQEIDPVLPDGVFNRLADNWRPLFAIAEAAGEDWPKRCADAFAKLSSHDDSDNESLRVNLLADIRQIFTSERMFSKDVIDALKEMAERFLGPKSVAANRSPNAGSRATLPVLAYIRKRCVSVTNEQRAMKRRTLARHLSAICRQRSGILSVTP